MIKRLHLYLIKQFIGPFILTFFIAEFVLIMQFLWLFFEDLIGKGLAWGILFELFISASAGLVSMALPLAVLLASVMTFGKLGENYELSAIKSAGISLKQTMKPLAVFVSAIALASFLWANHVVPYSNLKVAALMYDVGKLRPELNILPGVFMNISDKMSLRIGSKNNQTAMMYDVMIYDHSRTNQSVKLTRADSGYMQLTDNQKYMVVTLYGGNSWVEMDKEGKISGNLPERRETFQKQTVISPVEGYDFERTSEVLFRQSYQVMNVFELKTAIDSLTKRLSERKKLLFRSITNWAGYPDSFDKEKNAAVLNGFEFSGNKFTDTIPKQSDSLEVTDSIKTYDQEAFLAYSIEKAGVTRKMIEMAELETRENQQNIYKYQTAFHQKFTLPVACLLFFLIGAPLGAIIRKGGFGMPIIVSILLFVVYYLVSLSGKKFVEEGMLPAWAGMWVSSAVAISAGIFLVLKANNDSFQFNFGLLTNLQGKFRGINDFFKRI